MSRLLSAALLTAFALVLPARVLAAPIDAQRAAQAYAAMQQYLYDPTSGGYLDRVGAPPTAEAWPDSEAVGATIAIAGLSQTRSFGMLDARRAVANLARFRAGLVYGSVPGGAVYWDDNEWIAEDLLDWSALTGDRSASRGATDVFAAIARAWSADPSRTCPGGVKWAAAAANGDRNTVSTANGALVGLRLYAVTHRPVFLWWSRRMLDWLGECMLAPTGLYWDHIRGDGTVDQTVWSYNQGSVLAAYLELYRTTGDSSALARAEHLADASLSYLAPHLPGGEPPVFAATFFRDLLQLAAVDGRRQYVDAAETYATEAWGARDPVTGLFAVGCPPDLLTQAALVQLYAALAGS